MELERVSRHAGQDAGHSIGGAGREVARETNAASASEPQPPKRSA